MSFATDAQAYAARNGWKVTILHPEMVAIDFKLENGNELRVMVTQWESTAEFVSLCTMLAFPSLREVPGTLCAQLLQRNRATTRAYWCLDQGPDGRFYVMVVGNVPVERLNADELGHTVQAVIVELNAFEEQLVRAARDNGLT